MRKLLLMLMFTSAGLLAEFPLGEQLTRENVSVIVMKCCASIDVNNPSQVIVTPKGFTVAVHTGDSTTEEFRIVLKYRDQEGTERRSVHFVQRWAGYEFTSELFSVGDVELLDVMVTEYKPGPSYSFANPS